MMDWQGSRATPLFAAVVAVDKLFGKPQAKGFEPLVTVVGENKMS